MLASLKPIPFTGIEPVNAEAGAPLPKPNAADDMGLSVVFDGSALPMWIFDDESLRFLAVNDAAVRKYGWRREEFLRMTVEQVRPPETLGAFREYRRTVRGKQMAGLNQDGNLRHVTKAGEVLQVEAAWQYIVYGGRRAVLVTIVDRSVQQRAEEENRELSHVLNLASDAIIVCNLDREVLFWNNGATKLYGWTTEEALGKRIHELLKLDTDTVLKCMSALLEKGDSQREMNHARKEGEHAIVVSRWTLVRDEESGQPKCILLINSDITETKKLESQFLRTQRLESLGTLASGIAHDLNNILSPILMATGILKQSQLGPDQQKMLTIIEGSAERGAGIVKQVLTFARGAEGDRVVLQPKHIVSDMTKVMVQTFPKNIDIQSNIPRDLWMVSGDATQLHQVLLNLCVNARDAMGTKGGILRVVCENVQVDEHMAQMNPGAQLGPHVCISVTDTGSGMSPEVMEKIFHPFFTTKEQGKGTGLGLATVIGIVKGHKGFITVQSQVGVGTTFRVFIPADVEAKKDDKVDSDAAAMRGNGETLLVVDDEAAIREAIVTTLQANGYHCYTAEDGTDALALYFERRTGIAAVITDLHMGMMDGITLVRSLRKITQDVKVIVSSGHIHQENQTILNGLGVKVLLEKPYTAEKLLRSVKALLYPGGEGKSAAGDLQARLGVLQPA